MEPSAPGDGDVPIANVTLVLSMSDAVRVIVTGVSSLVVTACASATGASFVGLTAIETVASAESSAPSSTRKVKLSLPFASGFGVKETSAVQSLPGPIGAGLAGEHETVPIVPSVPIVGELAPRANVTPRLSM